MKDLMLKCENWGSTVCKAEIRRYNSGSGLKAKPVELPGSQLMKVYDRICRVCPNLVLE
jgi:hypothetical protein